MAPNWTAILDTMTGVGKHTHRLSASHPSASRLASWDKINPLQAGSDPALLKQALDHASAAFEHAGKGADPAENALAGDISAAAWLVTRAALDRNQSDGPALLYAAQMALRLLDASTS